MAYSTEDDVYEESGLNSDLLKNLGDKEKAQVTKLVLKYVESADKKIQRLLKVPISIRKEEHFFEKNDTVELGPDEDSIEMFSAYDPEDKVETIYALYLNGRRVKLPYPKDCDELTESTDDMTEGSNCTLTADADVKKCGDYSIKAVFTDAGSFYFPSDANLNKVIYPWNYIGFWAYTTDKTATFTITLYDVDGNTETKTFTLTLNNTWEIVSFDIDDFTGDIDWSETKLQKIAISVDKACTLYFDNFNFNEGFFWTYPEGLICWSDPDTDPVGFIEVTYAFDPYKVEVPADLREASAKMASIKLLDFCLGARQRYIAFKQMAEDWDKTPDKESMEVVRGRLKREVMEILGGIGFGIDTSIGAP